MTKRNITFFQKNASVGQARRQSRVTGRGGRHKQFFVWHKNFFSSNSRMKTIKKVFITKYAQNFTNSGMKTEKKSLHHEMCEFWGEDQTKKKDFHRKICKKMVLAQEYWIDDQYFGGVRPRTAVHSSGTEPVTFFGTQSSLGGHISRLGRHKQ